MVGRDREYRIRGMTGTGSSVPALALPLQRVGLAAVSVVGAAGRSMDAASITPGRGHP